MQTDGWTCLLVTLVRRLMMALTVVAMVPAARAAGVPSSPYLGYIYKYADAMLEKGRDTYGPTKSMMFLSALDRTTMAPLTTRPAAPGGIRREDRVGQPWSELVGANPQLDQNFLRLLYVLRGLSSQEKYAAAADAELKFFLENAASPETRLLAWGEHMFWNVMTDEPNPKEGAVHEFSRPWLLWDRCFELAPEASKRFALGLWEHQIANQKTGAYDRHAAYWKHGAKDGMDFARHGGFYIRTWAGAYAHTGDEVFLKAIDAVLARFEKKRDVKTGMIEGRQSDKNFWPQLSLAIDCDGASRIVPEPLGSRLRQFAAREDEIFVSLPHDLEGRQGFVTMIDKATGKPTEEGYTSRWDARYGAGTTAQVGMMCVSRFENMARPGYAELIAAAADVYLKALPGEDVDAWPMTFGHAISLELAAWRGTSRREYLDRARELGLIAIEAFFQDNPLPRASLKTGHFESITGADTLALALVELHLHSLHITAVRTPDNTIDR
ncbi:MAG: hypothetical protein HY718_19635 [Planctomycetes bacterium]|nr:hypothetical protein [Planctomycetota bacterium]